MLRPAPVSRYRLRTWTIRRFKSVADAEIPLEPLTVLLGPNSAGKSSLIQSILVFVQAQSAFERPDLVSLNGTMLKLGAFDEVLHAGPSAGRTKSIELEGVLEEVSGAGMPWSASRRSRLRPGAENEPTRLSWGTTFGRPSEAAPGRMQVQACWVTFDAPHEQVWHELEGSGPAVASEIDRSVGAEADRRMTARLELKRRRKGSGPGLVDLIPVFSARFPTTRVSADLTLIHRYRGSMKRTDGNRSIALAAGSPGSCLPGVAYQEVSLARLLANSAERAAWRRGYAPTAAIRARNKRMHQGRADGEGTLQEAIAEGAATLKDWWLRVSRPLSGPMENEVVRASVRSLQQLLADLDEGIAARLPVNVTESEFFSALGQWVADSDIPARFLVEMSGNGAEYEARETIAQYLATSVHYLGPVRTTARAVSSEAQYSRGVGVEGEITAAVLHGNWDQLTHYIEPAPGGDLSSSEHMAVEPLGVAVNKWMAALELGEVRTRDQARYGLEVTVRPEGLDADLDLRNVGVGISQVLPVVVLCLRSGPGSLLMIEQPELHLHPAAQQRLADFLIAMMRSGRQLIVETHSDHMVARLRRRIAEDPDDALQQDIGFLYVTRDPDTAATQYQPVAANIYGGLEDWPRGFFDQGPREAAELIRQALEKKKERESTDDA